MVDRAATTVPFNDTKTLLLQVRIVSLAAMENVK
jgi:hypothetical protein